MYQFSLPFCGQVSDVFIRENMAVSKGDTLIKLNTLKIDEQINRLTAKMNENRSFIADIKTILNNGDDIRTSKLKQQFKTHNLVLSECAKRLGVSLIIPIYCKNVYRKRVFDEKTRLDNVSLDKNLYGYRIYHEINNLLTTLNNQQERLKVLRNRRNLTRKVLEMRVEQYKMGTLAVNDYLLAKQKKVNADLALSIESYSFSLNMKLLDLYLGKI